MALEDSPPSFGQIDIWTSIFKWQCLGLSRADAVWIEVENGLVDGRQCGPAPGPLEGRNIMCRGPSPGLK